MFSSKWQWSACDIRIIVFICRDMILAKPACNTAAEERAVVRKECASICAAISDNDNDYRHRNLAKLMFIHMLGRVSHTFWSNGMSKVNCSSWISREENRISWTYVASWFLMLVTNSLKQYAPTHFCFIFYMETWIHVFWARDLAPEVERLLQFGDPNVRKKVRNWNIYYYIKFKKFFNFLIFYLIF